MNKIFLFSLLLPCTSMLGQQEVKLITLLKINQAIKQASQNNSDINLSPEQKQVITEVLHKSTLEHIIFNQQRFMKDFSENPSLPGYLTEFYSDVEKAQKEKKDVDAAANTTTEQAESTTKAS